MAGAATSTTAAMTAAGAKRMGLPPRNTRCSSANGAKLLSKWVNPAAVASGARVEAGEEAFGVGALDRLRMGRIQGAGHDDMHAWRQHIDADSHDQAAALGHR